jgi:hypothetical protein
VIYRFDASLSRPPSEESCAFSKIHSLEAIRISWIRQVDSVLGYWLKDLEQAVDHFLPLVASSGRAGTLRELAVYSHLFLAVPTECFRTLTRLDVWSPSDMKHVLERVIVCAPQLECLMIGCMDFDDLAEVLIANPTSLSRLYMLKVVSLDPIKDERSVQSLIDFLQNKKGMRRLDTNLPGLTRKDMGALIECYRDMKELDMLGIDARTIADPEDMEEFAASLPTNLVALHVQSCWENLPVDAAEFQPLVSLISLMGAGRPEPLILCATDPELGRKQHHSILAHPESLRSSTNRCGVSSQGDTQPRDHWMRR